LILCAKRFIRTYEKKGGDIPEERNKQKGPRSKNYKQKEVTSNEKESLDDFPDGPNGYRLYNASLCKGD